MDEVYAFCQRFLPILEAETAKVPHKSDMGYQAQITLELYTAELEAPLTGNHIFKGKGCGVIAKPAGAAEPVSTGCIPWVKPLPSAEILRRLHPHKNHLQTVGLLCSDTEKSGLLETFWKTGVVHCCSGYEMSHVAGLLPHDGEWPLRCYVKIVSE
jgi:hypothetical protein